jgi:hypothetical protein
MPRSVRIEVSASNAAVISSGAKTSNADGALLRPDVDGPGRVDALAEEAAHHVGEHDSRCDEHGRFFDRPAYRLGAGGAGVDTQEFRCALVDQAFAPHQRRVRHDVGRQQRLEIADGIQPVDQ